MVRQRASSAGPSTETPKRSASAQRDVGAVAFITRKAKAIDAALARTVRRVLNHDDEAVHDMRVAIRRLRTLLRFARPLFGRFRADAVRASFTAVQARTGELRDEEALAETLAALPVDDPAFVAWRERRRSREKRLRGDVTALLQAGDLTRARRMLAALLLLPVKPSRDRSLGRFARRAVNRARKKVESLRDVPTSDVDKLHELRILYKEVRYSAEIFAEALPVDLAAVGAPAARLQKRLGDIHDIDVAIAALSRARGLPPETSARVASALVDARARKAKKYLEDMAPQPTEDARPLAAPAESSRTEGQADGGVALRKISTF